MNTEVIITCAVTGAGDTAGKHPELPVTPPQIAAACLESAKAGAAIAHIHVRDPKTGKGNRDPALFREVVEIVRKKNTDLILNLTAGMGGDYVPSAENPAVGGPGTDLVGPLERLLHVEELKPDIASVDCCTMNFGLGNETYINTPASVRTMAERCKAWGVKPELEVFDLGHIRLARYLIDEGLIEEPAMFQICLGIPWGAGADTASLMAMRDQLPAGADWFAFGIGRTEMPIVAQSILLGGHVRVGLEDNLYLSRGKLASNGQLVEKAVTIIESLGARVLGPKEARERLNLKKKS